MSALPSPKMDIERIADNYVSGVLRLYENGSFVLFNHGCRIYAGISEPLAVVGGKVLVRMTKIVQPLPYALIEPLKVRCRGSVLTLDESVDISDRQLFYASQKGGVLSRLSSDEERHLTTNNLF